MQFPNEQAHQNVMPKGSSESTNMLRELMDSDELELIFDHLISLPDVANIRDRMSGAGQPQRATA